MADNEKRPAHRNGLEEVKLEQIQPFTIPLTGTTHHIFAGLTWIDSLLNASMILGGMGPVNLLTNTSAKVFASAYALFSGLVFIAVMGVVFSPIFHRMLHKFHMDDEDFKK
jgi:hypothetical protein